MEPCLFGLEAELALSLICGGRAIPTEHAVDALALVARRKLVHLPGQGNRMYLANGSLFYVDCGHHPEVATPECTTPWEAVSHLRAAERVVADLAGEMRKALAVDEVLVCRSNIDYLTGATWGCHESYLARLPVTRYREWLIPHLASRIIYTGSGGLNPLSPGIRFSVSPRVAYIESDESPESTRQRGIFHTRDEALATGYNRVHVLAGDNACSQLSTLLKVGTTALVVALAEKGGSHLLKLRHPVSAMKAFALDRGIRVQAEMAGKSCLLSALSIQYQYLDAVEVHVNTPRFPQWAVRMCRIWREALEMLGSAATLHCHAFDWTLKRDLFTRELARAGFTWESVSAWTVVLEDLKARWPMADGRITTIDHQRIDQLRSKYPEREFIVDQARRALGARDLAWSDLDAFTALRQRLCALDVRFGEVVNGTFDVLDRQDLIPGHRVISGADIASASEAAPRGTRASLRAEWVKRLYSERDRYVCDWQGIQGTTSYLDLSDPFALDASWRKRAAGALQA